MHLDKRLSLIASLVRRGSRIADIGTDHAYLPVWLTEQGVSPFAVAADIHEGPVGRAVRTVTDFQMSDRISVRLGNGLAVLSPEEVDDIIIAGMGGETIASILADAPWTKNNRYRFILQPMTKPELLREYLLKNGFSLLEEHIAAEDRRLYLVICAGYRPDAAAYQLNDGAVFYRGIMTQEEGRDYLTKLSKRLMFAAEARRKAGYEKEAGQMESIAASLLK